MKAARPGSRWTAARPGFRERYDAYMRSPDWAARRTRWFIEERERTGDDVRCAACGRRTGVRLELHHHDYDRLGTELHDDLTALCADCHEAVHLIWDHSRQWRKAGRAVASRALIAALDPGRTAGNRSGAAGPERHERRVR